MRIKLLKLYSIPEIFNPIEFDDGINLIMGEKVDGKSPEIKKGKKTNGVGKSLSMEFISFCLLKTKDDSRIMQIPLDKFPEDTQIILDLQINSVDFSIVRTKQNPDNPIIIKNEKKIEFSNLDEANEYLKEILFSGIETPSLSFREFIGPFNRDEDSEFKDIVECYDLKKKIPKQNLIKPHLFLFGINLSIINKIKNHFNEINKLTTVKGNLTKEITENKTKKISDVKSELNSLNDDLVKIDIALESFKTSEAYGMYEDELSEIQTNIDNLEKKRSALKYQLSKIKSLPKMEFINEKEIEIVYNQFKSGLGNLISKSIDQVSDFKRKIDEFQNRLINEKFISIKEELESVTKEIQHLENQKNKKLQTIDQRGVLKDIKNGYSIYHEKKDAYSKLSYKYEHYEETVRELKEIKVKKDENFIELDKLILEARSIINSFNSTILEIHEYIMRSNKASFDIKTINNAKNKQIVYFEMRIDDDGGHSIDRTKVFIYDLALIFNEFTSKNHPKFLIHDNIFDVDQDTLIQSLNYLAEKEDQNFQYILTLNRDKIENEEKNKLIKLDIQKHKKAEFTKANKFLKTDYQEL